MVAKAGTRSPLAAQTVDLGRAPATLPLQVAIGLQLRNRAALDAFIADVSDPASPNFQHFLTQAEFNAMYAPTPEQEQSVVDWLAASGFKVTSRASNRLIVGAVGNTTAAARAFGVNVHSVSLRGQTRYAALQEASFPADIASFTTGVIGLDNLTEMRPKVHAVPTVAPYAALGTNCCHFSPIDLATYYADSAGYTGSGQTVVIAGAYAWKSTDQTTFNSFWGEAQLPVGSAQVCTGPAGSSGCLFSSSNSIEVSLDVEYLHGTAPFAVVKNYMAGSTTFASFTTMYNKIVTDNPGHVVSTSWGACEAGLSVSTQTTDDAIFANGNAIGQSWFAASGDNGSHDCGTTANSVDHPANSPHVIGVGGTSAVCKTGMTTGSHGCGGWGSETAWSGSGGGASLVFAKPAWQTGCSVPADGHRDVPDVSLASNPGQYGNYVINNGLWYIVGGTSDAAPQWAGYFAELDQKKAGAQGLPAGRIYKLCGTTAYHDITSGSNGAYSATTGYDRVTGVGSIAAFYFLSTY
jgi:kumamolisin